MYKEYNKVGAKRNMYRIFDAKSGKIASFWDC